MTKNIYNGGYVYLIHEEGNEDLYKIGVTRSMDINKRLKALQTGNGKKLILKDYFWTDKPFKMEMMLHNKYAQAHEEGEWFALNEDNVKSFKEDCELCQKNITALKDNPFF
jgi:predicted GIY-YIG superfamily endonuclease